MTAPEPRNPLYLLLLLTGVLFCVTALAYAVVPVLENKAAEMGEPPPPSAFRDALRHDGWKWLLVEVAVLIALGVSSMGLDHYRRIRREAESATETADPPPSDKSD